MGVSSTTNRVVYTGNGSTTSFSFPYYFFALTDINVYLFDTVAQTATQLVLNTSFTITATANSQGLYPSGGTVVASAAPTSTQILVIFRSPSEVQNYSLLQNGTISSAAIVQQFDYLTLLIQRLEDQVSRCISVPDGMGTTFSPVLPANTPYNGSAFLQINNTGTGVGLVANAGWSSMVIPYTSVQTGATSNPIALFTLPPTAMLNGVVVKHSTAFAGSGITDVYSQIGIASDYGKFINDFDVYQSVADSTFDSIMANYIASFANSTVVYANFVSTGANLSALSAGSLTVYYQWQLI